MHAADKHAEKATLPTDSPEPSSTSAVPNPTPPRRRWPLVALVIGLVLLAGQIYVQREYWGLVLHQGTLFPDYQRAVHVGRREAESVRPSQELPLPGSPASFAGTNSPPPEPLPASAQDER